MMKKIGLFILNLIRQAADDVVIIKIPARIKMPISELRPIPYLAIDANLNGISYINSEVP